MRFLFSFLSFTRQQQWYYHASTVLQCGPILSSDARQEPKPAAMLLHHAQSMTPLSSQYSSALKNYLSVSMKSMRLSRASLPQRFVGSFGWKPARGTRMMRLPETSTTFEIFVQGLYHKRLFSDNRDLEHELSSKFGALASRKGDHQYKGYLAKSPETRPWRVLISLYVLGDYLDAQVVRIAAVDAMILRHERSGLMTFDDIDFAFANTSLDSKLRELLVHITTYNLDIGSTAREDLIGMPNEFLVGVSMTVFRKLPNRQCRSCYQKALSWVQEADAIPAHFHEPQDGPPWQTLNACYYHEHSTEEEKRDCAARFAREKVLERREQDRNRG